MIEQWVIDLMLLARAAWHGLHGRPAFSSGSPPGTRLLPLDMRSEPDAQPGDVAQPEWLAGMRSLVARGGPRPGDYPHLHALINRAAEDVATGKVAKDAIAAFWRSIGPTFMNETMQGFALSKPHGYAGDFEIIDRIYMQRMSDVPEFRLWDEFFHAQAAPRSVRNRAEFLGRLLTEVCERYPRPRVLNVGSGPCRDVSMWLSRNPAAQIEIDCVDQDARAIAYAKQVLGEQADHGRVTFLERNALRFRAQRQYDLMWSAGLFDYLSERLFVHLLGRLISDTAPGGKIVIGNFSTVNPSRSFMELFGEWHLIHRDEATLRRLAKQAGAKSCTVMSEPEGVNLFLVIHA